MTRDDDGSEMEFEAGSDGRPSWPWAVVCIVAILAACACVGRRELVEVVRMIAT